MQMVSYSFIFHHCCFQSSHGNRRNVTQLSAPKLLPLTLFSMCLFFFCSLCIAINATAVFGTHGVIGWIRFTQSAAGLDITANLAGLDSTRNASWSIRQFPVLNTLEPSLRGTDNYVGDVLDFQRESNNSVCSPTSQSDCQVGDLSGRCAYACRHSYSNTIV